MEIIEDGLDVELTSLPLRDKREKKTKQDVGRLR